MHVDAGGFDVASADSSLGTAYADTTGMLSPNGGADGSIVSLSSLMIVGDIVDRCYLESLE